MPFDYPDDFEMLCITVFVFLLPGILWLIHAHYDDFKMWQDKRKKK